MNDSSVPSVSASVPASASGSTPAPIGRILSVDALRGFDMFWIIGAEEVARALDAVSDGPVVAAVTNQLRHVEWAGFHFLDAIFPLFLFLVGVSAVLSLDRVLAKEGRRGALLRIAQRSFLLFAVALISTGAAKIVTSTSNTMILAVPDPLLGVNNRLVLVFIAFCELGLGVYCLRSAKAGIQLAAIAFISTVFLLYRAALWIADFKGYCGCLGNFGDALGLKPEALDIIAKGILAFMLVGSFASLLKLSYYTGRNHNRKI